MREVGCELQLGLYLPLPSSAFWVRATLRETPPISHSLPQTRFSRATPSFQEFIAPSGHFPHRIASDRVSV